MGKMLRWNFRKIGHIRIFDCVIFVCSRTPFYLLNISRTYPTNFRPTIVCIVGPERRWTWPLYVIRKKTLFRQSIRQLGQATTYYDFLVFRCGFLVRFSELVYSGTVDGIAWPSSEFLLHAHRKINAISSKARGSLRFVLIIQSSTNSIVCGNISIQFLAIVYCENNAFSTLELELLLLTCENQKSNSLHGDFVFCNLCVYCFLPSTPKRVCCLRWTWAWNYSSENLKTWDPRWIHMNDDETENKLRWSIRMEIGVETNSKKTAQVGIICWVVAHLRDVYLRGADHDKTRIWASGMRRILRPRSGISSYTKAPQLMRIVHVRQWWNKA